MNDANWKTLGISVKTFSDRQAENEHKTDETFKSEKKLYIDCLELHMKSMGFVFDLLQLGKSDLFFDAYVKLCVKILHNAEAIKTLLFRGLYGSTYIVRRTLNFDVLMIWYLYFNPDLISDWLGEKFVSYKNEKGWSEKFHESTIIKDLEEKGKKYKLFPSRTEFSLYSKGGHPSAFGIRFFQNECKDGGGVLAYKPDFNFGIFQSQFYALTGLLLFPTQVILEKCNDEYGKVPEFIEIESQYNSLMKITNKLGSMIVHFQKKHLGAKDLEDITST